MDNPPGCMVAALRYRSGSDRRAARVLDLFVLPILLGLLITACGPNADPRPSDEAIRHNNLGVALMDAGAKGPEYFPEAVREFEAALLAAPRYRAARINLGMALYYVQQTDKALATLESVSRNAADHPHVNYMLGLVKEARGDYPGARAHFLKVTQQDPQDPNAWYHLGLSFNRDENYDQAAESFRRAASIVPYQRAYRYNLFMALRRAGKREEAQAELDNFKMLEVSNIRVANAPKNALEYLKQGRYAEAIAEPIDPSTPVPPAPRYTDVASEVGLRFRHGGTARETDVRRVLQGEPMPRRWFEDNVNRSRLIAALGAGAAFCDYNSDGRLDVFLVNVNGRHALFEQSLDGKFQDVTAAAGLGGAPVLGMASVWGDYDNDGWTDLFITGYGEVKLYRNRSGRFEDVTEATGLSRSAAATAWYLGAAFSDVDHDGDLDIYVGCFLDLTHLPDRSELRFPNDFSGQHNLLFRNNRDGAFTEIARRAGVDGNGHKTYGVWFNDIDDDRAVDLVLLDFTGKPALFLNRKDGSFAASGWAGTIPPVMPAGQSHAFGDFNRDGAVDEIVSRNGEPAVLNRNDVKPANWLTVRLEGHTMPGQVKSNRLGVGTKIEVRTLGGWERSELRAGNGALGCDAAEVYLDLGEHRRADFVRATFPSGVRWTVKLIESNRTLKIQEPLLDVSSCPTLFAWNGKRFEFISDLLSAGVLGELAAPGRTWQPDSDEWVRITSEQFEMDGRQSLELRLANPLEEVTFLDQARLLALDHPAGIEVHANDRMASRPDNRGPIYAYALANLRPVSRAADHHGHSVTETLAEIDRRCFDHFALKPFKGFSEDWSLVLDLGALDRNPSPVLLLHGWSYWNSSSSVVAAAQAGEKLWGPILEIRGVDGRWRAGIEDLGAAAGLPRSIAVDLSEILRAGERVVRIRSNRTLYYDRIVTAQKVGQLEMGGPAAAGNALQANEIPLSSARFRWLGYPKRFLPGGRLPEVYDYGQVDQHSEWNTHSGLLTRYGEVLPLLGWNDDRLVVMGHGDELALSFDAARLPQPPRNWKRTFFFYADGYEKSFEFHSEQLETVGPLPFQSMKSYPSYEPGPSADEGYFRYLFEWNTRPSFVRRSN